MKKLLFAATILLSYCAIAQYDYAASSKNPFGKLNPNAPPETADFANLIGTCDCNSVSRIDQNSWADTVKMLWTFKYIMNGKGVQDLTLKEDGTHGGSIRQYNADSSRWYVYYYTSSVITPTLSTWEGGKKQDDIVLYKDQPAPNGMEGFYRLTFSNISNDGFNWAGEWVDKTEAIVYPTWRIFCTKIKDD